MISCNNNIKNNCVNNFVNVNVFLLKILSILKGFYVVSVEINKY